MALNFISLAQPSLLNLSLIANCHLVFPLECQIGTSESMKLTLDLVFSALLVFPNLSVVQDKKTLNLSLVPPFLLNLTYNLVADSSSNTFYIYIDLNHQFLLRLTKRLLTDLLHSVLVFYGLFSIHQSERYLEKAVSSWHWSAQTLPRRSIPSK